MYNVQCAMYNAVPAVGMRISVVLVGAATASTGLISQTVTLYVTSGRKEKMSEILFRGKDLQEHNGWLYGYFYKSDINKRERESGKASLIFTPNCDTFIYVPEYHNSWMVKAETVGQYTGLKDKNGTKIFEGDIIRDEDGDIMVVKWLKTSAAFVLEPKPFASIYFYGTLSSRIEVIGNIHDNPELLEVAENE